MNRHAVIATIILSLLILAPTVDCRAALPQQPSGLKFKDGWILKWGASMEDLASHFGKDTSITLLDMRKRSFAKDSLGMDEDHAIWDEATSQWRYLSLTDAGAQTNLKSIDCMLYRDSGDGTCSVDHNEISDPYTEASIAFDPQDRFNRVEFEFVPDAFVLIVGMLRPVWGKPKNTEVDNMQNAMGAQFQQTIMQWTIDDVSADLRKYGDPNSSEITFGSLSMTFLPLAPPTPKLQPQNPF